MWHSIACNSLYQLNVQQSSGKSKRDQITDKIHQRNEEISAVSILKLQIINELCGTPYIS